MVFNVVRPYRIDVLFGVLSYGDITWVYGLMHFKWEIVIHGLLWDNQIFLLKKNNRKCGHCRCDIQMGETQSTQLVVS